MSNISGVVNCPININAVSINDSPIVSSLSTSSLSNNKLFIPLSEEEIKSAISQLRSEKHLVYDGTLEMLSLGEDVTIQWLKSMFDVILATELALTDWHSQLLVPLHKK